MTGKAKRAEKKVEKKVEKKFRLKVLRTLGAAFGIFVAGITVCKLVIG